MRTLALALYVAVLLVALFVVAAITLPANIGATS